MADLSNVRPYGDRLDDGIVQLSFTLPVPYALSAKQAALELARKMSLDEVEVAHYQRLCEGYTHFVVYGRCREAVDFEQLRQGSFEIQFMTEHEIDRFIDQHFHRKLVVVGASTGTDTHSVGIDAMLNAKGFDGKHGLEAYKGFDVHNLGSQVSNAQLVAEAIAVDADAILVSQTVTQQNLHLHNLTELVDLVEAEGVRDRSLLICGGPRLSHELAKELGFDAGFSRGTYPNHLGTFIVQELLARQSADVLT
ncbi:Lysine 5,6-aminomutase beta subunit [Streptomyces sp. enrichment culture]|uniref:lysine 5,6-aminomutase subunit beta n=1 Tax=Streptomyces sp. enrichment culture TaxID=1795815 RepID=UPI003F571E70